MIPTTHKAKLPKTLSYPLGAEAISDALVNIPHIAKFTLYFSDRPVSTASEFQRLLRESRPYPVLEARYSPSQRPSYYGSKTMVDYGLFNEKWELRVNPVSWEPRQVVGQLLLEQGLPAVVQWARSSEQSGWESHWHTIRLVFDPMERILSAERENGE